MRDSEAGRFCVGPYGALRLGPNRLHGLLATVNLLATAINLLEEDKT